MIPIRKNPHQLVNAVEEESILADKVR